LGVEQDEQTGQAVSVAQRVVVQEQAGGFPAGVVDDWSDPDAPLLPSERRDPHTGRCGRVGDDALRSGLASSVAAYLPAWKGRLTPHGLRHFCASALYEQGLDIKAIQELLGHDWLSTTTRYIHVHDNHIEQAWAAANQRVAARLDAKAR
jgi:integrase